MQKWQVWQKNLRNGLPSTYKYYTPNRSRTRHILHQIIITKHQTNHVQAMSILGSHNVSNQLGEVIRTSETSHQTRSEALSLNQHHRSNKYLHIFRIFSTLCSLSWKLVSLHWITLELAIFCLFVELFRFEYKF